MTDVWRPSADQLWCRDLQHSWSPYTARREGSLYVRTLYCTRCASTKRQWLDGEGYLVRTQMNYPAGYLRPGEGRMTRDQRAELRVTNLKENHA